MLKTATIILPDNLGYAKERRRIERKLMGTFGGYTCTAAHGGWVDPATGEEHEEMVRVYHIAAEWNAGRCIQLRAIAREAAELMDQLCIYIDTPPLGVQFIQPAGAQEAAA